MKDYKERNNFILRTSVWKCLVPMFEKLNFIMAKVISKSYTLIVAANVQMSLHVPA